MLPSPHRSCGATQLSHPHPFSHSQLHCRSFGVAALLSSTHTYTNHVTHNHQIHNDCDVAVSEVVEYVASYHGPSTYALPQLLSSGVGIHAHATLHTSPSCGHADHISHSSSSPVHTISSSPSGSSNVSPHQWIHTHSQFSVTLSWYVVGSPSSHTSP